MFKGNLMKIKLAILFVLFSSSIKAGEISVLRPCSNHPLVIEDINFTKIQNLGEITIDLLTRNNIDYVGEAYGINKIEGIPIHGNDLEIISDSEMKAYGWCFTVNGSVQEDYPDQIIPTSNDQITWFYGFAHYLKGKWIRQCVPASDVNGCYGVNKFILILHD
jgi:hypothetical protein